MIKPEQESIEVHRVENGWVVSSGSYNRGECWAKHVARTPKELADLMQEWAQAQGDLPRKP